MSAFRAFRERKRFVTIDAFFNIEKATFSGGFA